MNIEGRRPLGGKGLLLSLMLSAACTSGTPAPPPTLKTLADLISEARQGKPYLAAPDGTTIIPMSAVVTPPGMDIYFRSPPFADVATINTGTGPQLNLLPSISQGRLSPYVTVELWLNNFGPVWVQPLYQFVQVDSNGHPVATDTVSQQPGTPCPTDAPIPCVASVAPPQRFYSPFWRLREVLVPSSDWGGLEKNAPRTERDVLDLPYTILDGPLALAPIVPKGVVVDPPLQPPAPGATPTKQDLLAQYPSWIQPILDQTYTTSGLQAATAIYSQRAYYEGTPVWMLYFGNDWFTELPGNIVQSTPIFVWVDLDANGQPVPIGLPSVAGVDALFSNAPWNEPGGQPDWDAFWELYFIVRPPGAQPFFPVTPYNGSPDTNAGVRAKFNAPTPSAFVSALPDVARYTSRMALNPACFQDTQADVQPAGDASPTGTWAASCQFLDSQHTLEANLPQESFIEPDVYVLCPIILWADQPNMLVSP